MKQIGEWIANAYYWVLWYLGFADTDGLLQTPENREKITFMLRRAKERMGLVWWLLSLATMFGVWTLVLLVSWWWIPLESLLVCLFVHVLWPYQPPDDRFWGGK